MPDNFLPNRVESVFECLRPAPPSRQSGPLQAHTIEADTAGGAQKRASADEVGQGVANFKTSFRFHVSWVKAGHDVLHERAPFILSLLEEVRWSPQAGLCVQEIAWFLSRFPSMVGVDWKIVQQVVVCLANTMLRRYHRPCTFSHILILAASH